VALTAHLLNLDPPLLEAPARTDSHQIHRNIAQMPRKLQDQRRLQGAEIQQLVQEYLRGSTVPELAQRYEINRSTVLEHLKRQNVPRRANVRKLTDEQVVEAAALYASGLSTIKVGDRFGVNAETIRRELKRAGFALRAPRGRATSSPYRYVL
jgi:DNA-directed RNA polymerase specialized sigma subunit